MMKQIFSGLLGLSFLVFIVFYFFHQITFKKEKNILGASPTNIPTSSPSQKTISTPAAKMLFVPSWTIKDQKIESGYDADVYFGITGTKDGIVTTDTGYKNIDSFVANSSSPKKLLAVVMTDSDTNASILDSTTSEGNIATESAILARQKGFDGVVLDYELAAISFDSVVKGVSVFAQTFANAAHARHLSAYMTAYGDSFYRLRPYDITMISKSMDGIMVMAYDFHKSKADPGPNFPLNGADTYGYDFKTMTNDFLHHTSSDKITVLFGMFGYDWPVDEQGRATDSGKAVTLNEATQKFLHGCRLISCKVEHDPVSTETKVTYKDTSGNRHEVWFENTESMQKKSDYLKTKGITGVGYWAYSFF